MGRALVQDEQLTWPDGGKVSLAGDSKLTVQGKAVATSATIAPLGVGGCGNSNAQCGNGVTIKSGAAQKLTIGGSAAVLDSSVLQSSTQAALAPPPAGQQKLTAN